MEKQTDDQANVLAATDDYQHDFDADAYCAQNYADTILPEDRFFIESLTQTTIMQELGIEPKSFNTVLDVGNSGVLIASGLMAPFIKDDGRLICADVGYSQLHRATKTIKKGRRGHLGIWQKYEDLMAQNTLWEDAIKRACVLGETRELSVLDLEPASVDAATMCYVAESVTANKQDFEAAVAKFFDAIRSGGLVIWCCMVGSQGYDSPGGMFSSYWIEPQDMLDLADDSVENIRLLYTQSSSQARGHAGPRYSGMALLIGRKR